MKFTSILFLVLFSLINHTAHAGSIAQSPLFLTDNVPPLVMLTMGRDHKLYYEAYNDASDLNDDGVLDIRYKPGEIDYFGYFDSYKCYSYGSGKFTPVSQTSDKTCSGSWSGDFLNYVTTSRIDALRKVLYGGYRSTDTTSSTILKRAFIPQDAHSWGKEYTSTAYDGYDISDYSPLGQPSTGTRHLFANVSLSYSGEPLMRVLNDSPFRIWEWVAIERPVAGTQCNNGGGRTNCAFSGGSLWQKVPDTVLSDLVLTTYDSTGGSYPYDHAQFDTWVSTYAISANKFGSKTVTTIEEDDNPFGSNDDYTSIVEGHITVPVSGTYEFSVDGDDAVEVLIDGNPIAGWYGGHGYCNCDTYSGSVYLIGGAEYDIEFRHQERGGGEGFVLRWNQTVLSSSMTDYNVNVEACVTGLLEANCKAYSDGTTTTYKPTGLLQRYGDEELMAFGLLTSSYTNNKSGGVIRKNISSFQDEIDLDTGIFTSTSGIVDTIDKLRVATFNYGSYSYLSGWITTRPINEGEAPEWGNPVAEMMYEGLRYFAGKSSPTTDFANGVSSGIDGATLGLPSPTWLDPYRSSGGYQYCATPVQMVISDVNTSFDSDQLPGSYFGSFTGDLTDLNVTTLADEIWAAESEASNVFIGQSATNYDGSPAPKTVTSFSNIRGMAPEEPTKEGSYYAGSIALYGQRNDISTATGDQNVDTLSVALASPLPRIEIPVSGKTVTLVPFAKSVGGSSISASSGSFQPTNQIVDFFVETIVNTSTVNQDLTVNSGRPYAKFRINYEDVEQAADHDMDAIVEYQVLVNASNELEVTLDSTYAAGGIKHHLGYVISGTTTDGTYLEVRDRDTGEGSDPDYFLDTPPGELPGGNWNDGTHLPLTTTRTFTVGSSTSASFINHDPLWYAAKWASEERTDDPDTAQNEDDGNTTLDTEEWDSDGDGTPDGYFLVTNAGNLEEQLTEAFAEVVARTSSSAAVATNSTRLDTNAKVYQARFNTTDWSGELLAFDLDDNDGSIGSQEWNAADLIPAENSRKIYSYNPLLSGNKGILFEFSNLNTSQQALLNTDTYGTTDSLGSDRLDFIRGDQTKEQANTNGIFRDRNSIMGDIINSDPWFSGITGDFGYSELEGTEGDTYATFRTNKLSRTPALFFGANDGMLHALNADTGAELFSYVPDTMISGLSTLTSPLYGCTGSSGCIPHRYYVDGAPKVGDAYVDFNNDGSETWGSVLVSTFGAGGKGLFALEVTEPDPTATASPFSAFSNTNILWEISTSQAPDNSDLTNSFQPNLGYTISQASIVRLQNDHWGAVVANGYDSTDQKAVLFIIDIETGEIIEEFDTGVGSSSNPNGMATPIVIDANGDSIADTIYAGDLHGNMWKIDISGNQSQWDFAFKTGSTPKPLYIALDENGDVQPITSKPQVGEHPNGGLMVYFGTGKYFEVGDDIVSASPQVQTFYGIRDQDSRVSSVVSRTDTGASLQKQEILYEITVSSLDLDVRATTDTQVDYSSKEGWFMDLVSPVNGAEGERVVSAPLLRSGRIIFTTLIPASDPCGWGGTSWLMEMDAVNGNRLDSSPFDVNEDGSFDEQDIIAIYDTNLDGIVNGDDTYPESGVSGIRKHDIGIIKTPGVIDTGANEVKYVSGSSGALDMIRESSGDPTGRQSWRQIK
jgi:type IV pilus assembly protein PilY1